jgi:hypothetical protein
MQESLFSELLIKIGEIPAFAGMTKKLSSKKVKNDFDIYLK